MLEDETGKTLQDISTNKEFRKRTLIAQEIKSTQ